jgi:hypothetical protein
MLETYVNVSRLRKLPKLSWWAVSNQLTDVAEYVFLNPRVEVTLNSMEQKTRVFC